MANRSLSRRSRQVFELQRRFFLHLCVYAESLAMLERGRRVVFCLLDQVDAALEGGTASVRREISDALRSDTDASELLLKLLPRLPRLRTVAVLRASTNQGVLAPLFIALRRSFAGSPEFSDVKFNNEARSWLINIETSCSAESVRQSLATMQAFQCSEAAGLAPPVMSATHAARDIDCRSLTPQQFVDGSGRIVRVSHARQVRDAGL
jgi:hypothetical protein